MSEKIKRYGMSWTLILKYDRVIRAIAYKYSGDKTLAEDVAQEVRLRLYTDRKLDIKKFAPSKRDAAIRNTIRNKILKALTSRKIGRWQMESLDTLLQMGIQVDANRNILYPKHGYLHTVGDIKDPEDDHG